jgi:hypothetical protein
VSAQRPQRGDGLTRAQPAQGVGDVTEDQPALGGHQLEELFLRARATDLAQRTHDVTLVLVRLIAVEPGAELGQQLASPARDASMIFQRRAVSSPLCSRFAIAVSVT